MRLDAPRRRFNPVQKESKASSRQPLPGAGAASAGDERGRYRNSTDGSQSATSGMKNTMARPTHCSIMKSNMPP